MVNVLEKNNLDRTNSVVVEVKVYEHSNELSFASRNETTLTTSSLGKTNSITDEIYELPKESSSSIYPDFERVLRSNFRYTYLQKLLSSLISSLLSQNSSSVDVDTILNAVKWIIDLRKIVGLRKYWWSEPLVNIFDSELVFEWWHGSKKITVYFSRTSVEFIKVWGADIDNEMEEGLAETSDQIESLWKWIAS